MKRNSVPGSLSGPPLSLGDINTRSWSSRLRLDARRTPCSLNITAAKSNKMKTGCNLAESSKKDYGSKRTLLPMMMMMMINYLWCQ
jgi:hypothetical protein